MTCVLLPAVRAPDLGTSPGRRRLHVQRTLHASTRVLLRQNACRSQPLDRPLPRGGTRAVLLQHVEAHRQLLQLAVHALRLAFLPFQVLRRCAQRTLDLLLLVGERVHVDDPLLQFGLLPVQLLLQLPLTSPSFLQQVQQIVARPIVAKVVLHVKRQRRVRPLQVRVLRLPFFDAHLPLLELERHYPHLLAHRSVSLLSRLLLRRERPCSARLVAQRRRLRRRRHAMALPAAAAAVVVVHDDVQAWHTLLLERRTPRLVDAQALALLLRRRRRRQVGRRGRLRRLLRRRRGGHGAGRLVPLWEELEKVVRRRRLRLPRAARDVRRRALQRGVRRRRAGTPRGGGSRRRRRRRLRRGVERTPHGRSGRQRHPRVRLRRVRRLRAEEAIVCAAADADGAGANAAGAGAATFRAALVALFGKTLGNALAVAAQEVVPRVAALAVLGLPAHLLIAVVAAVVARRGERRGGGGRGAEHRFQEASRGCGAPPQTNEVQIL
eukprot:Rhum_TRINITY_DN14488_c7_g3::Rhum_TRINITY_DN14488_c7_g3_i2::g.92620::m.92620